MNSLIGLPPLPLRRSSGGRPDSREIPGGSTFLFDPTIDRRRVLGRLLAGRPFVVLIRLSRGNAEVRPPLTAPAFRQIHDLPHVVARVGERALQRFGNRERHAANRDRMPEVFVPEALEGAEQGGPPPPSPPSASSSDRFTVRRPNSDSRSRHGFSPSAVRKSVNRDLRLPAT